MSCRSCAAGFRRGKPGVDRNSRGRSHRRQHRKRFYRTLARRDRQRTFDRAKFCSRAVRIARRSGAPPDAGTGLHVRAPHHLPPRRCHALLRARSQAESYARALPAAEGRPPFLLVVVIEVYSEFSCSGATYTPFPDPRSHRAGVVFDLPKTSARCPKAHFCSCCKPTANSRSRCSRCWTSRSTNAPPNHPGLGRERPPAQALGRQNVQNASGDQRAGAR